VSAFEDADRLRIEHFRRQAKGVARADTQDRLELPNDCKSHHGCVRNFSCYPSPDRDDVRDDELAEDIVRPAIWRIYRK